MSEQPTDNEILQNIFHGRPQRSVQACARDSDAERDFKFIDWDRDSAKLAEYFEYERAPLPPPVRTIVASYPDELTSGWIRGTRWLWVCAASRFVMFDCEGSAKVVSVSAPVIDAVGSRKKTDEILIVLAHEQAISVIVDESSVRTNPIAGVEITALSEHYIGTADGAVYRYEVDSMGVLLQQEWMKMPQKITMSAVIQIAETPKFVYALHSNSDVSGYTRDGAAVLDVAMGVLEDGIVELVPDGAGNCLWGIGRKVGDLVYIGPASKVKACAANTYEIPIPEDQAFLCATVNDGVLSVYTYPRPKNLSCAMVCVSRTNDWSLKVDDDKVLSTICLRDSGGSIKRKKKEKEVIWDKTLHIGDLYQEEQEDAVRLEASDTSLRIKPRLGNGRGAFVPWSLEQYKPDRQNTNLSAELSIRTGETDFTINFDSDSCNTWEWSVLEPSSTVRLEFHSNQLAVGQQGKDTRGQNNNMRIRKYLLLEADPRIRYSDRILRFGGSITRIFSGCMFPEGKLKQLAQRRMNQIDMSMVVLKNGYNQGWSPDGTHVACNSSEIGMENLVIRLGSQQVVCTKKVFGNVLAFGQRSEDRIVMVCTSKECIRLVLPETVENENDEPRSTVKTDRQTHATTSKRSTSTRTRLTVSSSMVKEPKVHVEWDSRRFRKEKDEMAQDETRKKTHMKPLMTHLNQRMYEWMMSGQRDGYIDTVMLKEWGQLKQEIERQNDIF